MRVFGRHPWLLWLIVLVAIGLNVVGYGLDLFPIVVYDRFTHAFTVLAVALFLGVLLIGPVLNDSGRHAFWVIVVIMLVAVGLGTWWEIGEWLYDLTTPRNSILGKYDTMMDLLMDSIGALVGAWIAYVWKARYRREFREPAPVVAVRPTEPAATAIHT